MTLELSREAAQIICEFVGEVGRKIDELGFKIDIKRKNEILSEIGIGLQLHSIELARKRGAGIVDAVDARNALKWISPAMIVRHALVDPQTFIQVEAQEAKYFDLLKNKFESSREVALLDAGCGWGRQLIGYRKRGLKGEFVAFDIDKDAVKLGKRLDPSIHFLVADIQRMPLKSHSFDAVVCHAVINFVKGKGAHTLITEFKRVLKPRGLLYLYGFFTKNRVLTSILNIYSGVFAKILHKEEREEEGFFNFYTLTHIKKLLFKNGFTDIRMEKGFLPILRCPFGRSEVITATISK